MLRYEEKIARFAQDKQFLRLSRPVRNRADAVCDACGSTQPRTLYGLTDVETGRHFFVGDSCLKELVKRESILRRFGKESGKQAYEDEMQLRAGPPDHSTGSEDGEGNGSGNIDDTASETVRIGSDRPVQTSGGAISSQVLMFETSGYYQCFVVLIHDGAIRAAFGKACVAKYEEEWSVGGGSGLVLEKLKKDRSDAPILCLAHAWQEAYSQLEGTGANVAPLFPVNFHGNKIRTDLFQPDVHRLGPLPAEEVHHEL